ncbi:VIT1/CCC1 transporter family protein [Derxia gummosa]|uniref:VIT1/CCC1 transporter family protein n=1 Tax=Derxia gummosa DSM 723 TaxID=1121388 RepID=A0A8B6XB88_9BURK|nr:VIT1/CCC1 family protein [Derxia gummosa]
MTSSSDNKLAATAADGPPIAADAAADGAPPLTPPRAAATPPASFADRGRWRANLGDELDSAALYDALAGVEPHPERAEVFRELARAERAHADFWVRRLEAAGEKVAPHVPSWRVRVTGRLARWFGVGFVLPSLAAAEYADRNKYANQPDAVAAGLSAEEQQHASVLHAAGRGDMRAVAIARGELAPDVAHLPAASPSARGMTGEEIVRAERWHRGASGNDLRAAVLGANDGLVSNFCLAMGVAGAGADGRTLLLTGVAGLVAGACSMALGEWLSVLNAREAAQSQMAKEAEEIANTPHAEQRELALIYQAKGIARHDAERVAAQIMADKDAALETLAREELGIDPAELGGNPVSAAAISFGLFAAGALVPILPFIFAGGPKAIAASVALTALALFGMGAVTSLFNGRTLLYSGTRQVLVAGLAALVTWGVGALFGVATS